MSELKSIKLLDTINGGDNSFISLELLSLELDDSTTELSIITDKVRFIISEMLFKGDDISTENNTMALMKNAEIGEKLRGYVNILDDYINTLNEKIEALNDKYTPGNIENNIIYKDVKTVKCLDNNNDLLSEAKTEIERNNKTLIEGA